MPAYVIANIDVHDPAQFEEYKRLAAPTVTAHGGRYIARGGAVQVLDGGWTPKRLVILEFQSPAAARTWWESADYAPAKRIREGCATAEFVIVEGM